MTSASSMHEAGHSKPVLWDNPEGWGGEWLIHVNVWQNPTILYSNYPPIKINKNFLKYLELSHM